MKMCDLNTSDNKLSIEEYKIVKNISNNYKKIFLEERTNHVFIYTLDHMEDARNEEV